MFLHVDGCIGFMKCVVALEANVKKKHLVVDDGSYPRIILKFSYVILLLLYLYFNCYEFYVYAQAYGYLFKMILDILNFLFF